jgi:hypothetical protein
MQNKLKRRTMHFLVERKNAGTQIRKKPKADIKILIVCSGFVGPKLLILLAETSV